MKVNLKDRNKKEFKDGDKVWWEERQERYAEPTDEEWAEYNKSHVVEAGLSGVFHGPDGKRLPDLVIGHTGTVHNGFFTISDEYDHNVYGWYVDEWVREYGVKRKNRESLAEIWKRLTIIKPKK